MVLRTRQPLLNENPTAVRPVYLARRWQRQPSGVLTVDWDNPLTQAIGLHTAWNGNTPRLRFRAPTNTLVNSPAAFDGPAVRSSLRGVQTSGVTMTDVNSPDIDLGAMPDMSEFTYIAVLSQGSTVNAHAFSTRVSSGTSGFDLLIGNAGMVGSAYIRIGSNLGTSEAGVPGLNDSFTHTYFGTWKTGNGAQIYVDRPSTTAISTAISGVVNHGQNLKIGNRAGTRFTGFVGLLLVGTKQNIDAGLQLLENPWQIFRTGSSPLYFLPAVTPPTVRPVYNSRSQVRTKQPQGSIKINWSNPLTRGLVVARVPGDNPSGGFNLVVEGGGVRGRYTTKSGVLSTSSAVVTNTFSFYVLFKTQATLSGILALLVRGNTSGASNTGFGFNVAHTNASYAGAFYVGDSYTIIGKPAGTLTTNTEYSIAGTFDGSNGRGYSNGVQTVGPTAATINNTVANLRLNQDSAGAGQSTNRVYVVFYWNRVLSSSEIVSLNNNPWQLFSENNQLLYSTTPQVTSVYRKKIWTSQPQGAVRVDPRVDLVWTPSQPLGWTRGVNGAITYGSNGAAWNVASPSNAFLSTANTAKTAAITLIAVVKFNSLTGTTFNGTTVNNGAVIYSQRTLNTDNSPTLCVSSTTFAGDVMRVWFGRDTTGVAFGKTNALVTIQTGVWYSIAVSCDVNGVTGIVVNGLSNATQFASAGSWSAGWSGATAYVGTQQQWPTGANDDANIEVSLFARIPQNIGGSELVSLSNNPWQLFKSDPQPYFLYPTAKVTWAEAQYTVATTTGQTLNAEAGAYNLNGAAAELVKSQSIVAESGAYAVGGVAATLVKGANIFAEAGAYNVNGFAAEILRGQNIFAEVGAYNVNGSATQLLKSQSIFAEAGAYNVNGAAADLSIAISGRVLDAVAGIYGVVGVDANLGVSRIFSAASGAYSTNGTAADLSVGRNLLANAGNYNVSGASAELVRGVNISSNADNYVVGGVDAQLLRSLNFFAESGGYNVNGAAAALISSAANRIFNAEAGSYLVNGAAASLTVLSGGGYPSPSDVRAGVVYGPGGIYVGTLTVGGKVLYIFDD